MRLRTHRLWDFDLNLRCQSRHEGDLGTCALFMLHAVKRLSPSFMPLYVIDYLVGKLRSSEISVKPANKVK